MDSYQCSPALHRRDDETCLPLSSLERLRRAWNRTHPRHKITISETRKSGGHAPVTIAKTLFSKLREAMKSHYKCSTEFCMIKKIPGLTSEEKDAMKTYFKPEKPAEWDKKPTQWLDSFNIEDVMNQYEMADKQFEFVGPVPIDFDKKVSGGGGWGQCIVNELCKLDLKSAEVKGKHKIGIIFNLDPHDMPGSHWVCAFIDIPNKSAYYFDSYGYPPPNEILELLRRCKDQGIEKIYYNDIRHQRKGSECGMYCLFCIICLLKGRPFYEICKRIIDDDTMNALRDVIFAEETPRREAIEKALPKLCT